jgi:hypothetical protein
VEQDGAAVEHHDSEEVDRVRDPCSLVEWESRGAGRVEGTELCMSVTRLSLHATRCT